MTLEDPISALDIKKINDQVHDKTGFNLSYFKPTFLSRRINVRMNVLHITTGSEYANLLQNEPDEINSLYDSLSINVTKFYRNKHVWKTFSSNIIPKLPNSPKINNTIRVWSAGCATGEEPYSIAIMLSEALKNTNYKIKIIATDINFQLLQDAKKGVYSFNTLQNLDPNLIKSYFTKEGKHQYKVNKKIKDLVSFHLGDIVTYQLSFLDVIFCRNLLIYYSKDSQNLILKKFHQVLKENKFLVLGMDESMLGHKIANSFLPIFPRERIYQKLSSTDVLSSIISEKK